MKMYLINLVMAYMGDHGKTFQSKDFCPQRSVFSVRDQSYEKNLI